MEQGRLESQIQVSPYTGEWIEISPPKVINSAVTVSPYTGEWIEILIFLTIVSIVASHLTQVSGLK